ncbi:MAG TPA: hypothetical protein DCS28_00185 [Candidatus Moranbacteria bacterium]|nr:hypothetical protein [Candidatus Moranbacteria bacterium]HAT74451.1 hypothetical protein [Candidatus Moranbacteria bacterium]
MIFALYNRITKICNKNPKTVNIKDIRKYLEFLADKNSSASTLNGAYSAFKFYFEKKLCRRFLPIFPVPNVPKNYPKH